MFWGPDDWDALSLNGTQVPMNHTVQAEALESALETIPDRGRKTVADLGCGIGGLLPYLADRFASVVAIDYAPASLAFARRTHEAGNIIFRRRDLRDLTPFRNSFHVAVALDSIIGPSDSDVDRILAQVHRSLVEGGLFLATFPAVPRSNLPITMASEESRETTERLPRTCYHEVELQYRLRKAGFQGIRIRRMGGGDPDVDRFLLCLAARRAIN